MVNPAKGGQAPQRRRGRPAGRTAADGVIAGRERLLDAAEALIRESGPNVSLQAIASAAGVTKPIVYREIGDRDALLDALAHRLAVRMAETLGQRSGSAATPREGLRNLVAGYLEVAEAERNLYLFVTAGGTRRDRVEQSLHLADGAAAQFAGPIAAYRRAQGADPEVALVWSYGLLGALHFITLQWLRGESTDRASVIDALTALLWGGINA